MKNHAKKKKSKSSKRPLSRTLAAQLYDQSKIALLSSRSNQHVVWQCAKCSDTWVATVASRTQGAGCPYCNNNGPKLSPASTMQSNAPQLAKQLANPDDRGRFSSNASAELVWECQVCNMFWSNTPNGRWDTKNRNKKILGCPSCNKKLINSVSCLEATHPGLAKELSNRHRGKCLHAGSTEYESWNCTKCKLAYVAKVRSRVSGSGCPFCAGQRVSDKNCLATVAPALAKELVNPNEGLRYTLHSAKDRLAWRCPDCKEVYSATPDNRSQDKSCPYCGTSKKRVSKKNSIKASRSTFVKELANRDDGERVILNSGKSIPWKCAKCGLFFGASPDNRRRTGCPYCSSPKKRVTDKTCIAFTHPKISGEIIRPFDAVTLSAGSNTKVGWQCHKCDGVWVSTPSNRTGANSTGCP